MGSKIGTIIITSNTLKVPHTNTHSKVTTALQRGFEVGNHASIAVMIALAVRGMLELSDS
jgi:hypothetical protein